MPLLPAGSTAVWKRARGTVSRSVHKTRRLPNRMQGQYFPVLYWRNKMAAGTQIQWIVSPDYKPIQEEKKWQSLKAPGKGALPQNEILYSQPGLHPP